MEVKRREQKNPRKREPPDQRPCHTVFVSHLVTLTQRVLALHFAFGYVSFYGEDTWI